MSSSGSTPPAPDRPAWFRSSEKKSAPKPSSAPPPKSATRPQVRVQIAVAPEDLEHRELTFAESVQKNLKEGLSGLAVSFGLHALILLILALIAFQLRAIPPDMWLDAGWKDEAMASRSTQARGPVDLAAIKLNEDAKQERMILNLPQQEQTGNQGKEDDLASSGVAPVDVKNLLANRNQEMRNQILQRHGGDQRTEAAIREALLWLKRQQREDGNWMMHEGYPDAGESTLRTDTGATALALLPFLGAGHTHRYGEHSETVNRGLQWLIRTQKPNGNFHDRYDEGHQSTFYAHSQALIVMCEAYALTGDDALREPAQLGVDFLVKSQNPVDGGWRYRPATEKTVGDLSVTGWALMALHTARSAGLAVDPEAYRLAGRFLDSVTVHQGTRYKYMPSDPDDTFTPAMTAEGVLSRQYLGEPRDRLGSQSAIKYLLESAQRPEWEEYRQHAYEWYYSAQALHNLGGEEWKNWYQRAQEHILRGQSRSGSVKPGSDVRGSWSPRDPSAKDHEYSAQGGRLYLTVMCVLILETPYRYAPIYEQPEQSVSR